MKLDPGKVQWIVRQKEEGRLTNRAIAQSMGVSPIWVKKLWRRYRVEGKVPELRRAGRKRSPGLSQQEKQTVIEARKEYKASALVLERIIDGIFGVHIPHNRIHGVLKEMGLSRDEPRKQRRRKWVRYERKYSNSLWHTDWTLIDGKGWMTAYLDDASRFVVGWRLFPEATSEHSVEVLKDAVGKYGKPASILTDRGTQFYAVEADERLKGLTVFEKYLIENEIRQILARVMHPMTNGKVERFFRTVKDKLPEFGSIEELIRWYNEKRPHMSLNLEVIETPHQAFVRKMPEPGIVIDEESGEVYHAQKS
ncbi:MAG: DDE-type integrase/transposase/recombinase [Nitrososphaerota archaeon]|nr:DDE-type integrase/transposase/recombinase [Nitrososphaerota archaeon]